MSNESKVQTVASTAGKPDTSLAVRFLVNDSKAEKAPVYHVEIYLPAPLVGTVLRASIFADRDRSGATKGYSVTLPGGSGYGRALMAAPKFVEGKSGEQIPVAGAFDPQGSKVLDAWEPAIKEALYKFIDTQNPMQRITLG